MAPVSFALLHRLMSARAYLLSCSRVCQVCMACLVRNTCSLLSRTTHASILHIITCWCAHNACTVFHKRKHH